jgi:CRISPR-associated protein Csb2
MSESLCITVTFLDRRFHGRGDAGQPEWPPSPLRLMQAVVAANARQVGINGELEHALAWLEQQKPPVIVAPTHVRGAAYCLSVPNNAMDLVAKAWSRGNYFGSGDANPATHRTMKAVCPVSLVDGDSVHYVWPLSESLSPPDGLMRSLVAGVRRVVALGWGIDMAVGDARVAQNEELDQLPGLRWLVSPAGGAPLRTPKPGTLDDLKRRHRDFLGRIGEDGFRPVPPLRVFDLVPYRRRDDPPARPYRVFELRNVDGTFFRYPHRRLIHIAGMVRHLAINSMKKAPPPGADGDWVERYVAGHATPGGGQHRQLSYLPLPSVGHLHTDPGVRRVMIVAPVGDGAWLHHVARRLGGQALQPLHGDEFAGRGAPILVPVRSDPVARFYTEPARVWHSFTPVILPGHDDRKPDKTDALIRRALVQSGIDQPCEFEWSAFSRFPKGCSAHKYGKDGRPQGYIRPDHLLTQTAVHLTMSFSQGLRVPGPIAIGAGRHCGFGLMVRETQW